MPTEGLSMRFVREMLRLHHEARLSQRQIARALQLSQGGSQQILGGGARSGDCLAACPRSGRRGLAGPALSRLAGPPMKPLCRIERGGAHAGALAIFLTPCLMRLGPARTTP